MALWGILPVHQAALGWYSVYGHALAATFTLFVLAGIVRAARGGPVHPLSPLVWLLLLFAAASSFGVGIGTACAMPVVALLLLPASAVRWRVVIPLAVGALVLPWLYLGLHALYAELYGMPDASAGLELALEFWRSCARMLFNLLSWGIVSTILGTLSGLVPFGKNSYATNGLVALYAIAVVVVYFKGPAELRLRIIGSVVLCIGAYSIIAVGRGPLAGWLFPTQEARYHYVGTAALAIVTCLVFSGFAEWWRPGRRVTATLLLGWSAVMLFGLYWVVQPIQHYDAARRETAYVLGHIQKAIGTVQKGEDVYIENGRFHSVSFFSAENSAQFPGWAGVFSIYYPSNDVEGRRIRFVEKDLEVIASTQFGERTAGLLVSPEEAPGKVYSPLAPAAREGPARNP